jgi:hypothetical protein
MPLDSDSTAIIDEKVTAEFNKRSPEVEGQSVAAIKKCWKKMVECEDDHVRYDRMGRHADSFSGVGGT